ncbi:MAG: cupin domain-containing protein [Spirochaetota bacterium]
MEENFSEKPLSAAGSVAYSGGAVVSKTVINKKVGTITLFAFDQGQRLSEHTAPFDALVNVLDGEGEIVIGGKAHRLHVGDFIVMPANIPHAVNAVAKFKMMLVMIRGE